MHGRHHDEIRCSLCLEEPREVRFLMPGRSSDTNPAEDQDRELDHCSCTIYRLALSADICGVGRTRDSECRDDQQAGWKGNTWGSPDETN